MRDKNDGYSDEEINEYNQQGGTYFGYLEYVRNWSWRSRFFTSFIFTYLTIGIPITIAWILTNHYDPYITDAMIGSPNKYNLITYLLSFLVIIAIIFFTSEFGLNLLDAWFTPRYNDHLSKWHPHWTQFKIDKKALKRVKIFSNICRVIAYLIFGYFIIFYIVVFVIIDILLSAFFDDGRTYHITKSHWY